MFDLDAARAAAADADAVGFDFTLGDDKFHMPPMARWPLLAQAELAEGRLDKVAELVLGKEAYQRLIEAGVQIGDMGLLFEELGKQVGVGGLGNSEPSAPQGSTPT